jgi:hypothetical protein
MLLYQAHRLYFLSQVAVLSEMLICLTLSLPNYVMSDLKLRNRDHYIQSCAKFNILITTLMSTRNCDSQFVKWCHIFILLRIECEASYF